MQNLLLPQLARFEDFSLLLMRVLTGVFLIFEVSDNIFSSQRMTEFTAFVAHHGFPWPPLSAGFSVYLQALIGTLFVLGLLTRWAGLLCALHFLIACGMVHASDSFRNLWPAAVLVAIGLHLAFRGAGRYSLDQLLANRLAHRAT